MFRFIVLPASIRRVGLIALGLVVGTWAPNAAYAQAAPPQQAPAAQAPAGQAPAGQAPAGQAPAGQAPAGQAPAGQAPAAQAAASTKRVFASDAGMVLNFIKPDKTADFEAVMVKLKEALMKS